VRTLRVCATAAAVLSVAGAVAACGGSSSSGSGTNSGSKSPIVIGTSLSLSGDFAADGQAFQRGYQLWANDVNAKGGILGRRVKLQIVSDASHPEQVVSNYQKLIGSDHDPLVLGPFSTLLTVPASKIANRYGYAFLEGAGGGPAVFATGLKNVFDVSVPVKDNLTAFAQYIASLPPAQRPKTAAYPTVNEQFTEPQIPVARGIMEAAGVKTVYSKVFPAEVTDFSPIAGQVAATHPEVVVLGAVDVPTVSAFVHAFIQQHFDPKAFIATAGPDQGAAFVKAVGKGNENGIFVPNGWFGGFEKADSQKMVKEYNAKYGGTPSDVNADVAEAYSAGQALAEAAAATKSLDNKKIIAYLHSGATLDTVQGPVKFDGQGENTALKALTFQWQNGTLTQTLPPGEKGAHPPIYPKPAWGS
jgi:branched-chain amino acid transport system substrate-binding protein